MCVADNILSNCVETHELEALLGQATGRAQGTVSGGIIHLTSIGGAQIWGATRVAGHPPQRTASQSWRPPAPTLLLNTAPTLLLPIHLHVLGRKSPREHPDPRRPRLLFGEPLPRCFKKQKKYFGSICLVRCCSLRSCMGRHS